MSVRRNRVMMGMQALHPLMVAVVHPQLMLSHTFVHQEEFFLLRKQSRDSATTTDMTSKTFQRRTSL